MKLTNPGYVSDCDFDFVRGCLNIITESPCEQGFNEISKVKNGNYCHQTFCSIDVIQYV